MTFEQTVLNLLKMKPKPHDEAKAKRGKDDDRDEPGRRPAAKSDD